MSEQIPSSMGSSPPGPAMETERAQPPSVLSHEESTKGMSNARSSSSGSSRGGGTAVQDRAEETASGVKARAEEVTATARERASEATQKAEEKLDDGMTRAAGGLDTAAEKIRETTPDQGLAGEAGEKVASGVEATAGYLREKSPADVMTDIEAFALEHPMQAVGGALVAGFVLGRLLR